MQALLRLPVTRAGALRAGVRHASWGLLSGRPLRVQTGRRWYPPAASAALDASGPASDGAAASSDDESIHTNEEYIAHCQGTFTIPGLVEVVAGPGGMPTVTLRHPNGASASLCLHGATITSWTGTASNELLHLREGNAFDGSTPIAGGVGLAWPQVGPGALPLHGLLRGMHWSVVETTAYEGAEDPKPSVALYIRADGADGWPHPFEALYSVSLEAQPAQGLHPRDAAMEEDRQLELLTEEGRAAAAAAARAAAAAQWADAAEGAVTGPPPEPAPLPPSVLRCHLQIHNAGDEDYRFTAGLLAHFAAEDIRENRKFVKVLGLAGKYVLDYAADPMRPRLEIEKGDFLFFNPDSGKNVDSLYVDCPPEGQILYCPGTQSHIEVRQPQGFTDLEVLHPAAAAPDVARRAVCLVPARKARPVSLAPGASWTCEAVFIARSKYWELPPFERDDPSTVPVPRPEEALPPRRGPAGEDFAFMDELNQ